MGNRPYDASYEPRPGEQAGDEERRWRRFVSDLARAGIPESEAEDTAAKVLCLLEQRITAGEARDLNQELPWALRDLLRRCERPMRATPERFDRAEFTVRLSEDLGREPPEAERVARAVLSAARALLSEREASDVLGQLPDDMKPLWLPPQ